MWDGWDEIPNMAIDGRITPVTLPYEVHPNETRGFPRAGHLGIWAGVLKAMEHAPLVTFEDDAILADIFGFEFNQRMKELPNDADFFSLFLPRDSDHMFQPKHEISGLAKVCRAYQPYGGVSMYYTEQGVEKIKKLLERDGICDQYDNTLYNYSWHGELNGYTSKPRYHDLVRITGQETSIVQETEYVGSSTNSQ
jgi:hypothetical protein